MTDVLRKVARAICKSRTCEGINCCQWPCNGGRWHDPRKRSMTTACRVDEGRYDDVAREAIAAMQEEALTSPSSEPAA